MSEQRVCAVCDNPVGPEWNRCEIHRLSATVEDFSTFTHPLSRPEYASLHADHGVSPAQQPPRVENTDERLRRLESLQRDTDAEMGHRIELLRDKVEDIKNVYGQRLDMHVDRLDALEKQMDVAGVAFKTINDHVQTQRELNVAMRDLLKNTNQRLDAALRRIERLERTNESLLDRVNQLVEFHGIRPIGGAPIRLSAPIDKEDV